MRLHYLQHVAFEDPACILTWAARAGHAVTATRLHEGEPIPDVNEFDLLVVMGGPMNVDEHHRYPWLAAEKRFIRESIDAGKHVLGICLGAQLIASALGARVATNGRKEIGWFPVNKTEAGEDAAVLNGLPDSFTAFHWHGDTFAIPTGAANLLASAACANQAFSLGKRVLAFQFHLESTATSIGRLIDNCGDELVAGEFVQGAEQMRARAESEVPAINGLLERVLGGWLEPGVARSEGG